MTALSHSNTHVVEGQSTPEATAAALSKEHINLYITDTVFPSGLREMTALLLEDLIEVDDAQFQYHFYQRTDTTAIAGEVSALVEATFKGSSSDLSQEIGESVQDAVSLMEEVTGCQEPFVSLRMINERYLGGCLCNHCETCLSRSPSVSRDWHIDSARFTLTAALTGMGTEYTPNSNVIRSRFDGDQKIIPPRVQASTYLHDPGLVYSIRPDEMGVLKGELRAKESQATRDFYRELGLHEPAVFNVGNGLVHRGPGIESGGARLLLTVSTY